MELQLLSEDGDVLNLIDAAIDRLHNGTYGRCLDCDQMIPEGRLKVRPYAIYCIKCKSKREEQMKY
jgi:DnaK suppressor protein